MESYFSIFLYIITFLCGFLLNNKPDKNILKRVFVIWLYIFLCFGYMTGSDWRQYELEYTNFDSLDLSRLLEPGFSFIIFIFRKLNFDFFLFLGIMKSLYLASLILLLRKYTSNWLAVLALLMPLSLVFMLIDNPLRFMMALIFVNKAICYIKENKIKIAYIYLFISILFHQTAVFFLLLPIFIKVAPQIYKVKSIVLLPLYIIVLYFSSNAALLERVMSSSLGFLMTYIEMKDYGAYYAVENNESFFTIGSFVQIIIFCVIICTKKSADKDSFSKSMWGISILYLFLSRVLIMIPTGFRLGVPFGYFFSIYLIDLPNKYKLLKFLIISYFALVLYKNVSNHYTYIPYSNSLLYIITGEHLSYSVRSDYNPEAFFKRTGKYPQQQ